MALSPIEIILKKRRGSELDAEEIQAFVDGAVNGGFEDCQLAALLMAICTRGMSPFETVTLAKCMAASGEMLDLSRVSGPKADKHSTGGVGDSTTLVTAPLVAACGVKVLKMSGRGLGHTGGTIDKLESIPGFNAFLTDEQFLRQAETVGLAITGQTASLAPADKKLYALRDVTGTVDDIALIASSILSKKLAAGCDSVVLDVKAGNGAMMKTVKAATALARTMVEIGASADKKYTAIVTDMNQPLGCGIGNALEVAEAIRTLRGEAAGPLLEVSLVLGAHMLLSAGRAESVEAARALLEEKLQSGAGLEMFARMIRAQGGDARVCEDTELLPRSREYLPIRAKQSGYIQAIKTTVLGNIARLLGAGRLKQTDAIDPSVGIVMKKRVGDYVTAGEPLLILHSNEKSDMASAYALVHDAVVIAEAQPAETPLIIGQIGV
jgi:pyrimidine-nucleoside phosphorylase